MLKASLDWHSKVICKIRLLMVYLTILLMIAPSVVSASDTPVVHEDPQSLTPSRSSNIDFEMESLLADILMNTNNISIGVLNQNFYDARYAFNNLDLSYDDYKRLAWQLNSSDMAGLVSNLNLTHDELDLFINNSRDYNSSRQAYLNALANGDSANSSVLAEAIRDNYANLTSAYDVYRQNSSDFIGALDNRNVDASSMQDTLNNFNRYMIQLSDDYAKLGIDTNISILELGSSTGKVPVGGSVTLDATLKDKWGNPVSGSLVRTYVDNRLAGTFTTDPNGHGQASYVMPSNVSGDHVRATAEYTPQGGRTPRGFSNEVELLIPDIDTRLSLDVDPGSTSYGHAVTIRGRLEGVDGTPAPGKAVAIYLQDQAMGKAVTNDGGDYTYTLQVTHDMPGGLDRVQSVYSRKDSDVFLGSASDSRILNVLPLATALSINGSGPFYLADRADFGGKLTTDQGTPVQDENITIYIDETAAWTGSTDANGDYSAAFAIPYDMAAGSHGIYASFNPGEGKSLISSRSEILNTSFIDSGHKLGIQGLPLALFKGDTLNFNGTFNNGRGAPISGRSLAVEIGGIGLATVKSDAQGDFSVAYAVSGNVAAGLNTVTVSDINSSAILQAGQIFMIPYDKTAVLFAFLTALFVISVIISLALRARKPGRRSRQKPARALEMPAQVPVPAPAPMSATSFDIENAMKSIRWYMDSGDLNRALLQVYMASRQLIGLKGVGVDDSMTHLEFYKRASDAFPAVSMPLGRIVILYELTSYANSEVSIQDMAAMLNDLEEIRDTLGGRPTQ